MLKPFSVRYLIGAVVCANESGLDCFLLHDIDLTIISATFASADECQQLDGNEVGIRKGLKIH